MFYKALSRSLFPFTLQDRADGNTIPFKQMRKPRSRELNMTFPEGCMVSGGELFKSSVSPC